MKILLNAAWSGIALFAAVFVVTSMLIGFILWLLTCVQTKKDAKKMNEVIEKKD